MRLVQRREAYPLSYLLAAFGSLATVLIIVLAFTGDAERAAKALTSVDLQYLTRVFLVVAIISLSGVLSYRSGLWNIGQEGQAIMGALAAVASDNVLEALALAVITSTAWALTPALLRAAAEINEAVTTFLFSMAAVYVARYFVEGPLRDPAKKGFVVTIEAPSLSLIIAAVLYAALLITIIALYKTRAGLTLRLLASGEEIVRYAGKSPKAYIIGALLLSGALAGVGGAVEIMTREAGRYMTLQQVSTGFGLYGISAAWLGALHPLGAAAASLYIAWLYQVAVNLKVMGLPALVANALVGTAMAWGLAGYVMYKYRVVWR
ncbi:ABC transporter permease [Pyrobaculum aerophilum]|uniref:Ribose ABC transporter, permease protein n=2 Tax=Pyrobaculum aerophilum TaxID=13773 RepID=Q8ZT67_PYRAE|nr:ABC transporter permease [Pyrobaculum aerophilum]AAL64896.1 ribose ABC transporter, permease protein [Pyrobaculum aerophilum str. IM2]MCX8135443.1 ABC transporter permease [Pyrobaculum aerophilum]HII47494.1 ABC transporter permease [Pyrobaculum aerophilum]